MNTYSFLVPINALPVAISIVFPNQSIHSIWEKKSRGICIQSLRQSQWPFIKRMRKRDLQFSERWEKPLGGVSEKKDEDGENGSLKNLNFKNFRCIEISITHLIIKSIREASWNAKAGAVSKKLWVGLLNSKLGLLIFYQNGLYQNKIKYIISWGKIFYIPNFSHISTH